MKKNADAGLSLAVIKKHGRAYLMEAAGLGGFVILAGCVAIFLEHPALPTMKSVWKDYLVWRRIPLGLIMGAYIWGLTRWAGKTAGAHINPAVTWTYFSLGRLPFIDSVLYTLAQFVGAVLAAQGLKYLFGDLFSHPSVNYGITLPKPPYGTTIAFMAEFISSFGLMLLILYAGNSSRLRPHLPLLTGGLIAFYLVVELPFSGMSLNPARSFAGALAGHNWTAIWVYFVAPPAAMLLAGRVFLRWKKN